MILLPDITCDGILMYFHVVFLLCVQNKIVIIACIWFYFLFK